MHCKFIFVYVYHIFFIHSSADGHLGCFHVLTIIYNAAINICWCCSVTKSCLILCDPKDYSTPGFPALHYFLEFDQTHVHWVGDAIQASQPLLSPSPPALNLSQHQSLFQWVSSSHQVAITIGASALALVLPMNIQGWFPLVLTNLMSLLSKGLWKVLSSITVWKHQIFSLSLFYGPTGKTIVLTRWTFVGKGTSLLFNMLSMFVIAFLTRSKHLLISWLQSPSAVI